MKYFYDAISKLRDQALIEDQFDYGAFEDYTEIDVSRLKMGHFFSDELKTVEKDFRMQYVSLGFAIVLTILFFIVAITIGDRIIAYIVPAGFSVAIVIIAYSIFRTKTNTNNMSHTLEGLQRGVVLNSVVLYRHDASVLTQNKIPDHLLTGHQLHRHHRRMQRYDFLSIFFPDTKTYIKLVFFPRNLGRFVPRVGDTVLVYKLAGEFAPSIIPTKNIEAPTELIQQAEAIRETQKNAIDGATQEYANTSGMSADGSGKKVMTTKKLFLIIAIIIFVTFALPIIITLITWLFIFISLSNDGVVLFGIFCF